ncbi:vWA domain-containing protein [Horticoccus sp. 23ND18S-11]|uniref:vWA domain-containing protein n=1 Tax=Horticoccus sp. 23ND18S-11 TaxID=3391832 RepID=UPI0039C9D6EC
MKTLLLVSCTAALLGAIPFALSARSLALADGASPDPVRLRIDVDRTVLPAETPERAVVKIGLDCIRLPRRDLRPPVNLALVIDRSGSMSGDKIEKAREAALEAVRRLGPDDIVALIAYDSGVQTLVPAQRVGDGRRLERAIRGIEAGGNTALHGGVTRGAEEIRRHMEDRRFVNRVVLLSDGLANVGPRTPDELGRLGTSLLKEGISVTTIGLGLGFNEDLMTRLAQRSDGNTYFVEHSGDLPGIFAAELGDVLNVVARRVVIEIDFPAGVRPLAFVGRDGTIRGQRAELSLNQLYGGQEKFALIEVEVAPGRADAELEIARARVSYDDAVKQRPTTLTAQRSVRFSASRAAVVGSADHKVQADYAANVMAVAKDEAVVLVDSNRRDEAAARLRAKTSELKKIADTYQNSSVQQMAAAAAPEADRLEKEGLGNAERKNYRAESAQTRSQQSSQSR